MCDWGGGPYGNGAYDSHGITKHAEKKLDVGKAVPVKLDEEKVREIIKEELEMLRQDIIDDIKYMLVERGQPRTNP